MKPVSFSFNLLLYWTGRVQTRYITINNHQVLDRKTILTTSVSYYSPIQKLFKVSKRWQTYVSTICTTESQPVQLLWKVFCTHIVEEQDFKLHIPTTHIWAHSLYIIIFEHGLGKQETFCASVLLSLGTF